MTRQVERRRRKRKRMGEEVGGDDDDGESTIKVFADLCSASLLEIFGGYLGVMVEASLGAILRRSSTPRLNKTGTARQKMEILELLV